MSTTQDKYKNKEMVLQAIDRNLISFFKEADLSVRSDKEVALAAVKKNGQMLRYTSANLRRDPEVALEAIKQTPDAFNHVDVSLKSNRDFVIEAIKTSPTLFQGGIDRKLRSDKEVVLAAVKANGYLVMHADEALLTDREIASTAVSNNGNALRFLPAFQNDREIVVAAVQQSPGAILHASQELQTLAGNPTMTDTFNDKNIAARLQSGIQKEALEAKMAARGITFNQEGRGKDLGFAL